MFKLFLSNLKMTVRNKQALFWSLMFPIMFTFIFGSFFGKGGNSSGTIVFINHSNSILSENLKKTLDDSGLFKYEKESNVEKAKDLLKKNKITGIIEIPEHFGDFAPDAPTKVKVTYDPANLQSNVVILGFLDKFLTNANFQSQNIQPRFSVEEEKTNSEDLTYFDFVLVGIIGMALMNSSIQGVGISMSRYREDKILKRITTTPLKSYNFIIAEVLSRLFVNLAQISLILGIGIFIFDAHIYGNIGLIYLFSLVGAILFQSIGFVIAALSRTTAAAEGMATAIAIPMMFLAGVFFPIDQLPSWLLAIVKYLPLAPLLRIIRSIALESASPFTDPANIAIVMGWIIIMLSIASYKFRLNEE